LTFPQLLWNQCPHLSHCVPNFKFLSYPLHNTCRLFLTSTPSPEFCSNPPITNITVKASVHRRIFPV
jgi:hypothetical protein